MAGPKQHMKTGLTVVHLRKTEKQKKTKQKPHTTNKNPQTTKTNKK